MKNIKTLALCILVCCAGLSLAQDEVFTSLERLERYPLQHSSYQCARAYANDMGEFEPFAQLQCLVMVIVDICQEENPENLEGSLSARRAQCHTLGNRMWQVTYEQLYEEVHTVLRTRAGATDALRELETNNDAWNQLERSYLRMLEHSMGENPSEDASLSIAKLHQQLLSQRTQSLYGVLDALR